MSIGVLETGDVPAHLEERFGRYAAMMRRLLGPEHAPATYRVHEGELPLDAEAHGGYLITGSPAGVYDPLPWIEPLKDFLRRASGSTRVVGICFGHQIMAEAYGGRVERSPKGWGLGLHGYDLARASPVTDAGRRVAVAASHQDQVVVPPPDAEILGGSAFTPFGILHYPERRAFSVQFHPEFEPGFSEALVELKRLSIGDEAADRAVASLRGPHDAARVVSWIRRFFGPQAPACANAQ